MSSIDVVVPCYRYGRFLRQCVHSVLSQGIADLRVLIIDDESPDETPLVGAALAREDTRVSYRRHTTNRGHLHTYNEGIRWTRADYMLLLSADDYLLPGALRRAIDLLDAHPDVGLCFGEALLLQDNGSTAPMEVDVDTGGAPTIVMDGADFMRLCMRCGAGNIVPTPTAVVKTRLLDLLGGYRYDLPHSGDFELWLRLAAHGPVGIVKSEQAVYRRHAQNMSLTYFQDNYLSDLQQRKAAFDAFAQTCGSSCTEAPTLYRGLLQSLAHQAVRYASTAFNNNRMELSRQLCDFAVAVCPGVQGGVAWNTLACKRLMGPAMSGMLRPTIASLRAATSIIRLKP